MFLLHKEKVTEDQCEVGKAIQTRKMEITGNWRGDNDQISTEKQISSENVNIEGEHVKTIELGYLLCLYISYASYMLS